MRAAAHALLAGGVACAVSGMLTPACRWLARRLRLLDVPNERSSHHTPTPRNGGYAIVLGLIAGASIAGATSELATRAMIGGAVALSVLAAVDELRELRRRFRLSVQTIVAGVTLWLAGGVELFVIPALPEAVAASLALLAGLLWIVWVTNAYNFMDGVNGIASLEAIVCGVTLGVLLLRQGNAPGAALAFAVAGAAAGFVPFNLASGSIFMGDVGSATLGFMLATLVLVCGRGGDRVAAGLPLLPFLLDATVTLLVRAARGEQFYEPHKKHFYQRLNRQGWSHASVAMLWAGLAVVCSVVALRYASLGPLGRAAALLALLTLHAAVAAAIVGGERRGIALRGRPPSHRDSQAT